ncbi:MAG: peptide chain release factor N(5)-glutamine methyltransferase [Thermodesulfobacteriota bacterium]
MKVRELYNQTVSRIQQAGIPDASFEAELLLQYFLGIKRVDIYLARTEPTQAELQEFDVILKRRLAREPLAYITGEQEFWSLSFEVSPAVLIPRPETELLIEKVIGGISDPANFAGRILDLGTGSGVIAVVLARELPQAEVITVDKSGEALDLARRNIRKHGVEGRVSLVNSDWFSSLRQEAEFDIIVSNPPYVSAQVRESLQPELEFEPGDALFAGDGGLGAYQIIIPQCRSFMKNDGSLLLEIGYDQAEIISGMIAAAPGLILSEIVNDYAGLPRVAVVKAVD